MQASSLCPLFSFPCSFSLCVAVFLFPSTFCLSFHPIRSLPLPILLPLTLFCFCLTAAGLLWEVIRKNSTETHTAAAENKAFQCFLLSLHALQQQKAGSRGKRRMREGVQVLPGHLQGMMSEGKCCFGKPRTLSAKVPDGRLYLLLTLMEAKGLIWSCLANWQPCL